jgi:hypothetical protein
LLLGVSVWFARGLKRCCCPPTYQVHHGLVVDEHNRREGDALAPVHLHFVLERVFIVCVCVYIYMCVCVCVCVCVCMLQLTHLLFVLERVLIEQLLQLLVAEVDAELLEGVLWRD